MNPLSFGHDDPLVNTGRLVGAVEFAKFIDIFLTAFTTQHNDRLLVALVISPVSSATRSTCPESTAA
jgi:hypothetical protein